MPIGMAVVKGVVKGVVTWVVSVVVVIAVSGAIMAHMVPTAVVKMRQWVVISVVSIAASSAMVLHIPHTAVVKRLIFGGVWVGLRGGGGGPLRCCYKKRGLRKVGGAVFQANNSGLLE